MTALSRLTHIKYASAFQMAMAVPYSNKTYAMIERLALLILKPYLTGGPTLLYHSLLQVKQRMIT
jgi:hypothetical protein